jgi:hypothetical protein
LKWRGAVQQLRGFDPLQGGVVVRRHQSSHYQTQRLLVFSNDSVTKLITRSAWSVASIHGLSYSLVKALLFPSFFRGSVCLSFPTCALHCRCTSLGRGIVFAAETV